ncbi:MAG: hypothetical protein HY064_06540 [Bacteroidetes bacterium]|nr:hypothetical protein [Bacteroidota bacterium]
MKKLLRELSETISRYDADSVERKNKLLRGFSGTRLVHSKWLGYYQQLLLFLAAYPSNGDELEIVLNEMERITDFLRAGAREKNDALANSGLPFTATVSSFSPAILSWVEKKFPGTLQFDSFDDGGKNLNRFLQLTLPDILKEIATEEGMKGIKLLRRIFGHKKKFIPGLIGQLDRTEISAVQKEDLFESLGMNEKVEPVDSSFSLFHNHIETQKIFFHDEILKKPGIEEFLKRRIPAPRKLNEEERFSLAKIIQTSLLLLGRETEPSTYMEESSLKIFELERGISIAVYGMVNERRQPLESYFGFTAFKNGYPMSYGGAWLFGKRALFGMNIFEWFRGGESAIIFCQLLRIYSQYFGVGYFEVEPYQYGKNNPEGIESGAFWFYYRFGFRPVNEKLFSLALEESEKINSRKGYRSSKEVLKKFTASNIGLDLTGKNNIPVSPQHVRERITDMIRNNFGGEISVAEKYCRKQVLQKTRAVIKNKSEDRVCLDLALFIRSSGDAEYYLQRKNEIKKLIHLKTTDEYSYQLCLRKFLK